MYTIIRDRYHRTIRHLKINSDKMNLQISVKACRSDNYRNMWLETIKIKGCKSIMYNSIGGNYDNNDFVNCVF